MVIDLNGIGWVYVKNMFFLYVKCVIFLLQVYCLYFFLLVCYYSQVYLKIIFNFFLVLLKGKLLWFFKVYLKLSEITILQIFIYRLCLLYSLLEIIVFRINFSEGGGVDSLLRSVDNL